MNNDPDSPNYNDTNIGEGFARETEDEKEIQRLKRKLDTLTKEHAAMADRLIEIDEVHRDDDGVLVWSSCGDPVAE